MLQTLSPNHALSIPHRVVTPLHVTPQPSTLGAHDFDVDVRTGFMPPQPPLGHMPRKWELWEHTLQDALSRKLKLGHSKDLTEADKLESEQWRHRVQLVSPQFVFFSRSFDLTAQPLTPDAYSFHRGPPGIRSDPSEGPPRAYIYDPYLRPLLAASTFFLTNPHPPLSFRSSPTSVLYPWSSPNPHLFRQRSLQLEVHHSITQYIYKLPSHPLTNDIHRNAI